MVSMSNPIHAGRLKAAAKAEKTAMSLAHYFTHIAHLIGHPSRALMLDALLGAEALPATALAESAGISAQTASRHLQLLADAGLLRVQQQG